MMYNHYVIYNFLVILVGGRKDLKSNHLRLFIYSLISHRPIKGLGKRPECCSNGLNESDDES